MLNFVALEASWVTFGDHFGLILGPDAGNRISEKTLNTIETTMLFQVPGGRN